MTFPSLRVFLKKAGIIKGKAMRGSAFVWKKRANPCKIIVASPGRIMQLVKFLWPQGFSE